MFLFAIYQKCSVEFFHHLKITFLDDSYCFSIHRSRLSIERHTCAMTTECQPSFLLLNFRFVNCQVSKKEKQKYKTDPLDLNTIFDRNLTVKWCLTLLYLLFYNEKAQNFISINIKVSCQTRLQSMGSHFVNIYRETDQMCMQPQRITLLSSYFSCLHVTHNRKIKIN